MDEPIRPQPRPRRRAAEKLVFATAAAVLAVPTITFAANPLAGVKLYVDPYSDSRLQSDAWRASRPGDAAQLDKMALQPVADWFGDWNSDVKASVGKRVTTIAAAGAVPLLVAYDIPDRDCDGFSSGGAVDAAAYKTWIRAFAAGIAGRKAVVVLEPDALAMLDRCTADPQARLDLLKDAIQVLKAQGPVSVYVDAGNSNWVPSDVMATRLKGAGVSLADGFASNVSNFRTQAEEIAYGRSVSAGVGGKHFVLDTSRNGLGAGSTWCNPDGRALGAPPSAVTEDPLVDAYLWLKVPGESDGLCNGGPAAGTFWADYALGLAQRAAWSTSEPLLSIGNVKVTEDSALQAVFTVKLSAPSTQTVSVSWATVQGTAKSDVDYLAGSGTLTFAPGVVSRKIPVTIQGDAGYEGTEQFSVQLGSPVHARLASSTALGTILDDDPQPLPSLSVVVPSILEGNSATRYPVFQIKLSKASTQPVTVRYATADGTALVGEDYLATSGVATIPAGSLSVGVAVPIQGGLAMEPLETFAFLLSAPTNAVVGSARVTATIQDNDTAP